MNIGCGHLQDMDACLKQDRCRCTPGSRAPTYLATVYDKYRYVRHIIDRCLIQKTNAARLCAYSDDYTTGRMS